MGSYIWRPELVFGRRAQAVVGVNWVIKWETMLADATKKDTPAWLPEKAWKDSVMPLLGCETTVS